MVLIDARGVEASPPDAISDISKYALVDPAWGARTLTHAAHCSAATFERLCMAQDETTRLAADAGWAARLYGHVAGRMGHDVAIADLESTFHFRWGIVTTNGHGSDPYYSRVLENDIMSSLSRMVTQLNEIFRTLPGLDPAELSTDGDTEATCACNVLYNRLGAAMINANTSQQDLLNVATKARDELLARAAERARGRLNYQAAGVRALQRVCAAVREGRGDIASLIDAERDAMSYLVRFPPPSLMSELEGAGVPLGELHAYLFPAVPARLNGAVLEMAVSRWAATYYDAVTTACINALQEMRQLSHVPSNWHGYAGIALWHGERQRPLVNTAIATGGVGAAARFPEVPHTHALRGFVLVATATSQPTALRVVRIAAAVHELVRVGLLLPRTMRAECILALVSRFGCEASVRHEQLLDGMDFEAPLPLNAARGEVGGRAVAYPIEPTPESDRFHPSLRGQHTHHLSTTLTNTLREAGRVPKSLQRDFVLLAAIRDNLTRCNFVIIPGPESDVDDVPVMERAYLGITPVCEQIVALPNLGDPVTPMIERFTRASLTMTVGHVMHDKIVKQLAEYAHTMQPHIGFREDDVEYAVMPSWVSGTKGVSFTRRGANVLMLYLTWVVQSCQPPSGVAFANKWHTSRSAKSHARRKQMPP